MAQTSVMPTLVFSEELLATAEALANAAKRLKGLARSLKKKAIDPSQAWYWTKEWQEAEKEADEDIKAGRVVELKSADDLDKPFEELFGKK